MCIPVMFSYNCVNLVDVDATTLPNIRQLSSNLDSLESESGFLTSYLTWWTKEPKFVVTTRVIPDLIRVSTDQAFVGYACHF